MSVTKNGNEVDHPVHYNEHPSGVECIDIVEHMNFCLGNAVKYIWRASLKGKQLEDLKKAQFYINREIERLENEVLKEIAEDATKEMRARDEVDSIIEKLDDREKVIRDIGEALSKDSIREELKDLKPIDKIVIRKPKKDIPKGGIDPDKLVKMFHHMNKIDPMVDLDDNFTKALNKLDEKDSMEVEPDMVDLSDKFNKAMRELSEKEVLPISDEELEGFPV